MMILIKRAPNICTTTCVVDVAIKSIIGQVMLSVVLQTSAVIIPMIKHASIVSGRSPGRFIIIITGFFSLLPNPVKGKSQKAKENCFFKRRIRIPPRPYCKCKKNQGKQKYFYFPLLLHSNLFNIFNYNFRHHISRFIHLTFLKYGGIQQVKQEKISFCIYKQDRKNSDPSSLRVKI